MAASREMCALACLLVLPEVAACDRSAGRMIHLSASGRGTTPKIAAGRIGTTTCPETTSVYLGTIDTPILGKTPGPAEFISNPVPGEV